VSDSTDLPVGEPEAQHEIPTVAASEAETEAATEAPTVAADVATEVRTVSEAAGADTLSPAPVTSDERKLLAAGAPAFDARPAPAPAPEHLPAPPVPPPAPPPAPASLPAPGPRPAPAPAAREGRKSRTLRQVLVAGLAGGIVGALVAAGMYTVFEEDSTSAVGAPPAKEVIVRPSPRITTNGDIREILDQAVPAVVAIVDDGGPASGGAAGTGFVVSSDGVIVTNYHVVEGAGRIQAHFSDGEKLSARVLGTAPSSDLAVLQVDGTDLPTIELGDSDTVQVGDDVVAIGNALALEGGLTVTRGIVSGLHRDVPTGNNSTLGDVIQTDAAINPGNSGGPLVDANGRVIGINTAIADPSSAQNVGFAIPISQVKSLISELKEGRRPALLGVSTEQDSDEDGALIAGVESDSPADRAGMEVGDVVVQVGNTEVHTNGALRPAIRRYKAGEQVDVTVVRDGKQVTLKVTLGEASEADS
jgi:putative serine protease PepD